MNTDTMTLACFYDYHVFDNQIFNIDYLNKKFICLA